MLERMNYNGIYQCVSRINIDYHAALFFVYKYTKYFRFFSDGTVSYYERLEGQKYDDNDYLKVYELLSSVNVNNVSIEIEYVQWNERLKIIKLNNIKYYFLPSIFSELIDPECKITQFVLDSIDKSEIVRDVYNFIEIKH